MLAMTHRRSRPQQPELPVDDHHLVSWAAPKLESKLAPGLKSSIQRTISRIKLMRKPNEEGGPSPSSSNLRTVYLNNVKVAATWTDGLGDLDTGGSSTPRRRGNNWKEFSATDSTQSRKREEGGVSGVVGQVALFTKKLSTPHRRPRRGSAEANGAASGGAVTETKSWPRQTDGPATPAGNAGHSQLREEGGRGIGDSHSFRTSSKTALGSQAVQFVRNTSISRRTTVEENGDAVREGRHGNANRDDTAQPEMAPSGCIQKNLT